MAHQHHLSGASPYSNLYRPHSTSLSATVPSSSSSTSSSISQPSPTSNSSTPHQSFYHPHQVNLPSQQSQHHQQLHSELIRQQHVQNLSPQVRSLPPQHLEAEKGGLIGESNSFMFGALGGMEDESTRKNGEGMQGADSLMIRKRRRGSSSELIDLDDFLGTMPSEPVSAYDVFGDGLESHGEMQHEVTTLTTQDHCLVMAQKLLEMAKRNECCDLEIVLYNGKKPSVLPLHAAYACAASPVIRYLLLERGNHGHAATANTASSSTSSSADLKGSKRETLESSSPSGHSISGDTDSYESSGSNKHSASQHFDDRASKKSSVRGNNGAPFKLRKTGLGSDGLDKLSSKGQATASMARVSTRLEGGSTRHVLELRTDRVDVHALEVVRMYMYTGVFQFSSMTIPHVLETAVHLDMHDLVRLALEFIQVNISEANVLHLYQVARELALHTLTEYTLEFLCNRFDAFAASSLWIQVPSDLLRQLVSRDSIRTESEVCIFRAVAAWARADAAGRNETMLQIICNDLRLANMTRMELMELSKHEVCASSKAVRRALYDEAVSRVNGGAEGAGHRNGKPRRYGAQDASLLQTHSLSNGQVHGMDAIPLKLSHCERTITDHDSPVCGLAVVGKYVVTASGNTKLRVFNSENDWRCERILEGHAKAVVALKAIDGRLISASPDKTIRVWSTKTWNCIRVLDTGKKLCSMTILGDKLVAGSDDGFLKSWSLEGWGLLRTVPAHQHIVWALAQYGANTLISGSSDTSIKVWTVHRNEFTLMRTLKAHNDEVQALAVDHQKHWLFSGSDDGTINIHCCKTWTLLRTVGWQGRAVLSLLNVGNGIVAGLGNGCVVVWDVESIMSSEDCAVTLAEHKSCVMALAVLRGRLLTASFDKTVKVWAP